MSLFARYCIGTGPEAFGVGFGDTHDLCANGHRSMPSPDDIGGQTRHIHLQ